MKIIKNTFIQSLLSFGLCIILILTDFIQPLLQKFSHETSIYSNMFLGIALFLYILSWIFLSSLLLCFFQNQKLKVFLKFLSIQLFLLGITALVYYEFLKNKSLNSVAQLKNSGEISQAMQQLPLLDPDRPLTILNTLENNFQGLHLKVGQSYFIKVRLSSRLINPKITGRVFGFIKGQTRKVEILTFNFSHQDNPTKENLWVGEINLRNLDQYSSEGLLFVETEHPKIYELASIYFVN